MGRIFRYLLIALVVLFLGLQVVPVERTNPPVEGEIPAPPEVREILRRACYDCHSNETVWPWYSYVAPVSFLVARDVKEGREELNFSTWSRLSAKRQNHILEEVWEEVEEGEMPLPIYLPTHPEARLTPQDRATLRNWTRAARGGRDRD
ncbi:MAG: heme-binding domain-containing protein [Acidobacteriota bacterium]|nr:heme-binding domain-containing protein [Acidobacteriota bacterium]